MGWIGFYGLMSIYDINLCSNPFSSTLHSNKREWTTGTQTDEAHRYYVQDKERQTKKSIYCMILGYSGGRDRLDRLSKVRLSEGVLIPAR